MSASSQVVVAPASCRLEPNNEPATYAEWVRRNKSHLKNLILHSSRAHTHGAHERTCAICQQGQRIIYRLIAENDVASIRSSFPKKREIPGKLPYES